jgi:hypothetical protein
VKREKTTPRHHQPPELAPLDWSADSRRQKTFVPERIQTRSLRQPPGDAAARVRSLRRPHRKNAARPQAATEPEKQIAQKIVDLNFRINRITAIENNMLNFDMGANEPDFEEDEGIARMMGQARAWKQDAHAFEILGRYEARLSKQLLQYQKELERLKTVRKAEAAAVSQTEETVTVNRETASFGKPAPTYVMERIPLPPPDRLRLPQAA